MKTMKRLGCLLLVVAMCLALGVSAFAEPEADEAYATIEITNVAYNDQEFSAYQIFSGDVSSDGKTMSNIQWGSGVDATSAHSFYVDDVYYYYVTIYEALAMIKLSNGAYPFTSDNTSNGSPLTSAEAVAAALESYADGYGEDGGSYNAEVSEQFAAIVSEFLTTAAGTSNGCSGNLGSEAEPSYTYTIDVEEAGYYLVMNTSVEKEAEDEANTRYILQIIGEGTYPIVVKEEPITWDKTITGVENGDAAADLATGTSEDHVDDKNKDANVSVGDTVHYELNATIPDISEYKYYYFIATDTLSKGLTLNVAEADEVTGADTTFTIKVVVGEKTYTLTGYKALTSSDGTDWAVDSNWTLPASQITGEYFLWGSYTDEGSGKTYIYIDLYDFLQYAAHGETIYVTIDYDVTLNEDAVVGIEGNENDSTLIHSNDPSYDNDGKTWPPIPGDDTPLGETPRSQTWTYTTGIEIDKIDGSTGQPLAGAAFTLEGEGVNIVVTSGTDYIENTDGEGEWWKLYDVEGGVIQETFTYTQDDPANYSENAEQLARYEGYNSEITNFEDQEFKTYDQVTYTTTNETTGETSVTVMVDENGVAKFEGLGAGTYTITETTTPDGYNTIDPIQFTIVWVEPGTAGTSCIWYISDVRIYQNGAWVDVTGEDNDPFAAYEDKTTGTSTGIFEVTIENNQGIELPGTGGIGTTIFYIVGAVLVCGAIVLLVTKRRMNNKEEANA